MPQTDINLEKSHWALALCALPAFHPSQQCSSAWKHGTLALPALLLVKITGSTHFPVFFCQLWEKALISFLPPRCWPWWRCEKPSLRATALQHLLSPQCELLSPLFVSLNSVTLLFCFSEEVMIPRLFVVIEFVVSSFGPHSPATGRLDWVSTAMSTSLTIIHWQWWMHCLTLSLFTWCNDKIYNCMAGFSLYCFKGLHRHITNVSWIQLSGCLYRLR